MGETLYEQIAEHSKELNLNDGDDYDDADDDKSSKESGPESGDETVRGHAGQKSGERPGEGDGEGEGSRGRGRSSKDAPRGKSGASSENAGTRKRSGDESRERGEDAQEAGGGTQKDASASQEDGEDGAVRGQRGQHELDEPEKPLTNADWARQRRENRELKAKLAKLEAEKASPPAAPSVSSVVEQKPTETKPSVDPASKEPDKNVNYQEWLEWKLAQTDNTVKEQSALLKDYQEWKVGQENSRKEREAWDNDVKAFYSIEEKYTQNNPDYGNATEWARAKYFDAIKMSIPQATDDQINTAINNEIMAYARQWAAKGLNPAEEFYDMAIERFGYNKENARIKESEEAMQAPPLQRKAAEKPNLKMISSNKRRSASPLSGGGQGGGIPLTKEIAADMTMSEFSKLTPDELASLEAMG